MRIITSSVAVASMISVAVGQSPFCSSDQINATVANMDSIGSCYINNIFGDANQYSNYSTCVAGNANIDSFGSDCIGCINTFTMCLYRTCLNAYPEASSIDTGVCVGMMLQGENLDNACYSILQTCGQYAPPACSFSDAVNWTPGSQANEFIEEVASCSVNNSVPSFDCLQNDAPHISSTECATCFYSLANCANEYCDPYCVSNPFQSSCAECMNNAGCMIRATGCAGFPMPMQTGAPPTTTSMPDTTAAATTTASPPPPVYQYYCPSTPSCNATDLALMLGTDEGQTFFHNQMTTYRRTARYAANGAPLKAMCYAYAYLDLKYDSALSDSCTNCVTQRMLCGIQSGCSACATDYCSDECTVCMASHCAWPMLCGEGFPAERMRVDGQCIAVVSVEGADPTLTECSYNTSNFFGGLGDMCSNAVDFNL